MERKVSTDGGESIHVQIDEGNGTKPTETGSSNTTNIEPQRSLEKRDSSNSYPESPKRTTKSAPEKRLTLFALRLAVLEKTATGVGSLGFVWATVVLLGGFAITLDETDFWFVTIILLIEGARLFSRSHELEWQHEATWTVADAGAKSFRAIKSSSNFIVRMFRASSRPAATAQNPSHEHGPALGERTSITSRIRKEKDRTWTSTDVPIFPYAPQLFSASNISRLFNLLQFASAIACIVLSLFKLVKHNYGDIEKGDTDKRNRKAALNLFYALALADAVLFLMEKTYWEWKINYWKLFEEVNKETDFGPSGLVAIRRFFYDAYSKCINASIFDGIKMDMVSFGMDLLASKSPDEQLIGARILQKFATNDLYSFDTLQNIGMSISVVERLVEMLNWKAEKEEEIRQLAAIILSKLASKKQNALRLASIPGAMESISSLLHINGSSPGACYEVSEKEIKFDDEEHESWTIILLGLLILKKLANDHDNCGKIGITRGLLPKIIDFTQTGERLLKDDNVPPSQILRVNRSLQVIKRLSNTTGNTGKQLRQQISEVVLTVGNIREILKHGGKQPVLQKLGCEILTNLAQEEDSKEEDTKERIGSTGGILKELFNIFMKEGITENQSDVRIAAGEALAMLSLESPDNCNRLLKLNVVKKLVEALMNPLFCENTARILRNLCTYSGSIYSAQLKETAAAAPTVLRAIMTEENKLQEVMVGLAPQIFKFTTRQELSTMFEKAEIQEIALATKLVDILKTHKYPSTKVPRIRRFVIDLTISMMRDNEKNIQMFNDLGLKEQLDCVMETTSELENFNIFSGTVGVSRHATTIDSLVETALHLLLDN